MIKEDDNELNELDKNLCYGFDTRSSQNINTKRIDTDPISYLSDLIIQISKNISPRGLSQAGVNALYLFLLTGGLLYKYTIFPETALEIFKLYIVPLSFLFYFLVDMLKNINFINKLVLRIFKETDFTYCAIVNNSVSLDDLENYLIYKSFNSQQFIDIIEHLIKENQFSPQCQVCLMYNTALYEVESINYVKDLLLKFEFTPRAICVFLKNMEHRLDYKYLDKLTEKYCNFPSVLFSVGLFHMYKIDEPNSLYKYGYECFYERNRYRLSLHEYFILFCIASIATFIFFQINANDIYDNVSLLVPIGFLIFIILGFLNNFIKAHSGRSVRKYLMEKNTLEKNIIEDIINDLDEIE